MKQWKFIATTGCCTLIAACGGNPGDISDAEIAKYKELGAPKI